MKPAYELEVEILGVPFDYGIKLVGGRTGARFAPDKILKEFFLQIKKSKKIKIKNYEKIAPVKNNVIKTHERVTKKTLETLKKGSLPIVIGGGHDITFASSKAAFLHFKKIGQINIDAHYDVRPVIDGKITSGTPFRRLLDGKFLNGKNFVELGLHSPSCLHEHYQYLMKNKATVMKLENINKTGLEKSLKKAFSISDKNTNATVFDIDIDGVMSRFAPGCSAPGKKGFTKKQILKAAYLAGKNKKVKLFNLMEVSPVYDIDNKTVKLASEIIISFIKGLGER